jgi:hypothetical protein
VLHHAVWGLVYVGQEVGHGRVGEARHCDAPM